MNEDLKELRESLSKVVVIFNFVVAKAGEILV